MGGEFTSVGRIVSGILVQSNGDDSLFFAGVLAGGALLGVYALWKGFKILRHGYRVWSNDPVPAAQARSSVGIVEVEGLAEPLSKTVSSEYTDTECLAYTWKKKKEETGDGDDSVTFRTLDAGSESVPFIVSDDSGKFPIDPAGAELSLSTDTTDYNRNRDVRRYESRLNIGDKVHVYGQRQRLTEQRDEFGDETVNIGDGEEVSQFRISDSSEASASLRLVGKGLVISTVGLLMTGAFGIGVIAFLGVI